MILRGLISMAIVASAAAGAEDYKLPDPLTMQDGRKVTTPEQWRAERRPELLELFRKNVYGRAPIGRPKDLHFETIETTPGLMDGKATRKQIDLIFSGPGGAGKIRVVTLVPSNAPNRVPAFLLINHRKYPDFDPAQTMNSPFWPTERIVERGYAAAIVQAQDADPDFDDGFKNGVHGIFDDALKPRAGDAWATIAAWAWAASRAMDYLEIDPAIDASKVAVLGHSRGGKTALWAGAQDERFALVISNDSGCTGAALSKRIVGETVKKINDGFPHWFCTNYRAFNDREDALPIDQHELIALIAPRLVYAASASEDAWADPEGEFLSCVYAGPVYTLFNRQGLESTQFPKPETPLHGGSIGYHLRTGKHDLAAYDWERYMDFADKKWK